MVEVNNKSDFITLFLENQRRIFAFILMFIPNRSDAEDIMQETAVVLWEDFDKYTPGTNFGAWAVQVARFKILNLNRMVHNRRLRFDINLVDIIDAKAETVINESDDRMNVLRKCLSSMKERDRWRIYLRYEKRLTTQKLAQLEKRSVHGLYKTMARIHKLLFQCIRRTLVLEGNS
jgi:RNA polymerase sigma-70 factor (ECF subfamily)